MSRRTVQTDQHDRYHHSLSIALAATATSPHTIHTMNYFDELKMMLLHRVGPEILSPEAMLEFGAPLYKHHNKNYHMCIQNITILKVCQKSNVNIK